ncbi:MAG: LysM peptidoglycan-binding domain-containing protein [Ardenticatenaceae bacterium]|nr:LysM peptidoglycan-binding domain-containing protein [Anaerolineales bacterium]MCB8941895.1 LysM peptidoglycan-binding domain-containing protein [Ardenticatenaceae bacterium]MCB8973009.1 LysM peptidoglycan-binding domain-containing protein [Ardenticatenaceae bacterium]
MDFLELLKFAPLILGFAFIAFLLFRKDPFSSFNLGKLITYFIGVLITFYVVGWFVDSYVFSWANARLESADTSTEFQEFKDRSEQILDNSLNDTTTSTSVQAQPTAVQVQTVIVTATPVPGSGNPVARPESGPTQYTVVAGDTLFGIAQRYSTSVNDIMVVNGLTSHTIIPGQVLNIPAPSQ